MALTGKARARICREKKKRDPVKWADYKRKDALRKSNYRRTAERNDPVLFESIKLNERARQIKSREKVKKQESDNISPAFSSKSSKARSVVRVSRALPKQLDQRKEVVRDLTVEAIDATPRKKRAIATSCLEILETD